MHVLIHVHTFSNELSPVRGKLGLAPIRINGIDFDICAVGSVSFTHVTLRIIAVSMMSQNLCPRNFYTCSMEDVLGEYAGYIALTNKFCSILT